MKSSVRMCLLAAAGLYSCHWHAHAAVPCDNDGDCYKTKLWRCLQTTAAAGGRACTLDYKFNETGFCACSDQQCVPGKYSPSDARKQYLVIGDSVSMGYFKSLEANVSATHQAFHAPGNNDNVNWGSRCVQGWLGPNPGRWDVITMNFGLHDLAFPDNEHLPVAIYSEMLANVTAQLKHLAPKAKLAWVSTTPVPTDPPPSKKGTPCTLIPGRLESSVLAYNKAAAGVMRAAGGMGVCDMHSVITDYCGMGYKTCDIAQCGGPHFPGKGFIMLGEAMGKCVTKLGA